MFGEVLLAEEWDGWREWEWEWEWKWKWEWDGEWADAVDGWRGEGADFGVCNRCDCVGVVAVKWVMLSCSAVRRLIASTLCACSDHVMSNRDCSRVYYDKSVLSKRPAACHQKQMTAEYLYAFASSATCLPFPITRQCWMRPSTSFPHSLLRHQCCNAIASVRENSFLRMEVCW